MGSTLGSSPMAAIRMFSEYSPLSCDLAVVMQNGITGLNQKDFEDGKENQERAQVADFAEVAFIFNNLTCAAVDSRALSKLN